MEKVTDLIKFQSFGVRVTIPPFRNFNIPLTQRATTAPRERIIARCVSGGGSPLARGGVRARYASCVPRRTATGARALRPLAYVAHRVRVHRRIGSQSDTERPPPAPQGGQRRRNRLPRLMQRRWTRRARAQSFVPSHRCSTNKTQSSRVRAHPRTRASNAHECALLANVSMLFLTLLTVLNFANPSSEPRARYNRSQRTHGGGNGPPAAGMNSQVPPRASRIVRPHRARVGAPAGNKIPRASRVACNRFTTLAALDACGAIMPRANKRPLSRGMKAATQAKNF